MFVGLIGSLDELVVGCTEVTELWISEMILIVTTNGKFDGLLLGTRLGLIDGVNLSIDKDTKTSFLGQESLWHNTWINYYFVQIRETGGCS